jgi:hypothetical protein
VRGFGSKVGLVAGCLPDSQPDERIFAHNRGFAIVNDGPAFTSQLATRHYLLASDRSGPVAACPRNRPRSSAVVFLRGG